MTLLVQKVARYSPMQNLSKKGLYMNLSILPQYEVPSGYTQETFLRFLIDKGIAAKKIEMNDEIRQRIEYELAFIKIYNLINWYLITWDITHFANENEIFVGVGNGSACGYLINFLLGLTKVNPLKFNLKFEYYLNYIHICYAEFTIDIERGKEDLIYRYLVLKYGKNSICKYQKYDRRYNVNKNEYILANSNLVKEFENNTNYYINSKGLLCSKKTLYDNELKLPVIRLWGIDYLRNTNLKLLELKENFNLNVDVTQMPLNDPRVFSKFCEGNLKHIPFNDKMFTEEVRKFKPNCFNDLVLCIAVCGRIAKNIYENILRNKNEKNYQSEYKGTEFETILKETYYELAYNEQAAELLSIITQHQNFYYPVSYTKREAEIRMIEGNNNICCPKSLLKMLKSNSRGLLLKSHAIAKALDVYFGTYLEVLLENL